MTGQDGLLEKVQLEEATIIKKLKFCQLGKELKKQTKIAKRAISSIRQGF